MTRKIVICFILFILPIVFAVSSDNLTVDLITTGNDLWTNRSSNEIFNFTIENQNSSYIFDKINITVLNGFSFSGGSGNSSNSSWVCTNSTSNFSCNTATPLTHGNLINIWFNATSENWNSETNVTWLISLENETQTEVKYLNTISGIDGKAPQINLLNVSYNGSELENGSSIGERKDIILNVSAEDGGIGIDKIWAEVYYNNLSNLIQRVNLTGSSVFSGNISTSSLDEGNYTIGFFVNDTFGNLNNSYENFTFTLSLVDFPDLNITISNGNLNTDHNKNLTLTVSVMYKNSCRPVKDLNITNFMVYDKWDNSDDYKGYKNKTDKISKHDFSSNSSGIYLINYTVPDITNQTLEYGDHNIRLYVNKTNNLGNADSGYFLNGPYLVPSLPGLVNVNLQGNESKTIKFDISITNNGNRTINGVNLSSIESNNGGEEVSNSGNCKTANKQIDPGNQVTLCSDIEFRVTNTGDYIVTIVVNGSYDSNILKYQKPFSSYVSDTVTSQEEDDNNENVKETFDLGKASGQAIIKSTEPKKYLTILSFPEKVDIEQGKKKTVNVNVKAEDDWEFQDVTLKVLGINSSWFIVIPSAAKEMEPLSSFEYRVAFNIPEDAELKDYSGEFQASSSFETKKQPFTLSILPGSELQMTINQTIEDYQNQIQKLKDDIEVMRNKGYNTTDAEQKLQELNDKFNKLLAYRDGGNYKSAYELFDETENLLNQTSNILSGAVVIPSGLIALSEVEWLLPSLFGLMVVSGGYTFWGRHFKINKKLLKKIRRKKTGTRDKDLETISKQLANVGYKPINLKPKEKIGQEFNSQTKVSERSKELELIKNLAIRKR